MGVGRFARAAHRLRLGSGRGVREHAERAAGLALAGNTGGRPCLPRQAGGRAGAGACVTHGTVRRGGEVARRAVVLSCTDGLLRLTMLKAPSRERHSSPPGPPEAGWHYWLALSAGALYAPEGIWGEALPPCR